jgi:hypothetical protein
VPIATDTVREFGRVVGSPGVPLPWVAHLAQAPV